MSILVPLALIGWIPVVIVLFLLLQARHAVLVAMIGGWLFLPVAGLTISGLPDYDKAAACVVGVLLGTVLCHFSVLLRFRPSLWDLPIVALCLCPIVSSVSNGLGLYDGISSALRQTVIWGLPYFIGRLYFSDWKGLRDLALGIVIGGIIYAPLCCFEILMAPILHYKIYGFYQHSFFQHIRFGGYRPLLFLQHGLAVSMWMTAATTLCIWLWRSKATIRGWGFMLPAVSVGMVFVTFTCKSVNAAILLVVGIIAFYSLRLTQTRALVFVMLVAPCVYIGVRTGGIWDGRDLIPLAEKIADEERAQSLESRLEQEDLFSAKAFEQPLFGWSGWGRMFPRDDLTDRWMTRGVDSLWIVTLGTFGLCGLSSLLACLLFPVMRITRRLAPRMWYQPETAHVAALSMVIILHMFDNLFNGLTNPVFITIIGGLSGLAVSLGRSASRARIPLAGRVSRSRTGHSSSGARQVLVSRGARPRRGPRAEGGRAAGAVKAGDALR